MYFKKKTNGCLILDNSQSQIHFMNSQNSPIKQQTTNSPSLLSSPMQTQQGIFTFQDNSQVNFKKIKVYYLSNLILFCFIQITDKPVCTTPNDTKINIKQQQSSPHIKSMVRSPVKLDISSPPNPIQTKDISDPVDETITEVIGGKGDISLSSSSKSTASQQQKQQPISPQMVWTSSGPLPTTRTYLSPLHQKQQPSTDDSVISPLNRQNVMETTSPVIRLNFPEQNQTNILTQQQPKAKTASKRRRPNSKPKQPTNNSPQLNTTSSSASTPTLLDNRMAWPDTPRSLPSCGSLTTVPTDNTNQHLIINSLSLTDIDHSDAMLHYSVFNYEPIDIYSSHEQNETAFDDIFPSTPLLSTMSITESMLQSAERLPNNLPTSLPNMDYDEFFREPTPSSSSTLEENQSRLFVSTPPNVSNNSLPEQQYYSQTNTLFDTNPQSQVRLLSYVQS